MRAAIVHYHLLPGGVSSVISSASQALADAKISHVILTGSADAGDPPVEIVEALSYSSDRTIPAEAVLLEMRRAAERALGGPPDVWHFHNHSLGKNPLFPALVNLLASAGEAIVLQLHDLAEEGRPQNYHAIAGCHALYPLSPRIHYAFINRRDLQIFRDAGIGDENASLLLNPVPANRQAASAPAGPPLILYPSRAIRRKNLGELLLLSILAPAGARFAITRAPESPAALAVYHDWKRFAGEQQLPVIFEAVDDAHPFEDWLQRCTHFVTTSIAEGFGLVFQEAPARRRALIGRDLPTNESKSSGLYQRIFIPSDWLDESELRRYLTAALTETHRLYQRPLPPAAIDETFNALRAGDHFDFGNLPEPIQKTILLRLLDNPQLEPLIDRVPARKWLAEALSRIAPDTPRPEISYAGELTRIYDRLIKQPFREPAWLDPDQILNAYLQPRNFHFLLTAPPKIRAVIFDIYGTLLIAKPGAVKPDPAFDPELSAILKAFGHTPPEAPTLRLHEAVLRHHRESVEAFPEIDLRELWREILGEPINDELIIAIENAWHPSEVMPDAEDCIAGLSARGIALGLLSNAQVNTLTALGRMSSCFDPSLGFFSYQHRIAKPSPALFQRLADRLAGRGISPNETLFVGNDPLQDIVPAVRTGFRTALFTGHPDSWRSGKCVPDFTVRSLLEILDIASSF